LIYIKITNFPVYKNTKSCVETVHLVMVSILGVHKLTNI